MGWKWASLCLCLCLCLSLSLSLSLCHAPRTTQLWIHNQEKCLWSKNVFSYQINSNFQISESYPSVLCTRTKDLHLSCGFRKTHKRHIKVLSTLTTQRYLYGFRKKKGQGILSANIYLSFWDFTPPEKKFCLLSNHHKSNWYITFQSQRAALVTNFQQWCFLPPCLHKDTTRKELCSIFCLRSLTPKNLFFGQQN